MNSNKGQARFTDLYPDYLLTTQQRAYASCLIASDSMNYFNAVKTTGYQYKAIVTDGGYASVEREEF